MSGAPLAESLDLKSVIAGLVGDLHALREGKISVREASVRAELGKQILRGVHLVVQAQKYLADQALPSPQSEDHS